MCGEKIKELRMKRKMTQQELADALCVSRQAITKWENNTGMPDIENMKNICRFFNISLDELVYDTVERKGVLKACYLVILLFFITSLVFVNLENKIMACLIIAYIVWSGYVVMRVIMVYYDYHINKKKPYLSETGELLHKGLMGYVDPSYNKKAILKRLFLYFDETILIVPIQGLYKLLPYFNDVHFVISYSFILNWLSRVVILFVGTYMFFLFIGECSVKFYHMDHNE